MNDNPFSREIVLATFRVPPQAHHLWCGGR